MNKKLISTLSVLALLIIILVAGGIYIFVVQRGDISERQEKLDELNKNVYDPVELDNRYQELERRSAELDSILANREFNIPQNISSIKFYNFINNVVADFPKETTVNVEYLRQAPDKEFFFHEYKLTGGGNYNDVYKMVYAIEQSKELKKINKLSLTNLVKTDEEVPLFLVNFELIAQVYYSLDNRFAPAEYVENNLATGPIYDAFYPLIRNEIPPNVDNLLDVQGARLLALIPEGAFVADTKGNTYLVWEGEQVYLGYLTKIDYDNNTVSFILNKGGIIEQVTLQLDRNLNKK
ncbi:MAG: hypothetical protein MUE93_05005 [Ignavibacteriaceae bacterium]|jgi:hypothetical protein|nr:hypothetical protein [Ignavibacteriaceae bacterium]MCU0365012.1 hypothetical protein [Ignavibacteriaceae bacterium]MCU0413796.1 hypothetical protein [Ignavibacteriaceae bacterium]